MEVEQHCVGYNNKYGPAAKLNFVDAFIQSYSATDEKSVRRLIVALAGNNKLPEDHPSLSISRWREIFRMVTVDRSKPRPARRQVPVIIGRRHLPIKRRSSAPAGPAAKRRTAAVKMAVVYIRGQVCCVVGAECERTVACVRRNGLDGCAVGGRCVSRLCQHVAGAIRVR